MDSTISAAVVTVSDRLSRGVGEDVGGARAAQLLADAGVVVAERVVVADEQDAIRAELIRLAATRDAVITTGGTGLSPRDVTPEATLAVIERRLPGFEEAMRAEGRTKTPLAILSRAVVGVRGQSLIINLPGSPKGIADGLNAVLEVLPHAVAVLRRRVSDCAPTRQQFGE